VFRKTEVKNCRECGGVSYVKRKTMLFIDSISVLENRGEEITLQYGVA